jgi:hypothetical protein
VLPQATIVSSCIDLTPRSSPAATGRDNLVSELGQNPRKFPHTKIPLPFDSVHLPPTFVFPFHDAQIPEKFLPNHLFFPPLTTCLRKCRTSMTQPAAMLFMSPSPV